jgi:hypothetical protein
MGSRVGAQDTIEADLVHARGRERTCTSVPMHNLSVSNGSGKPSGYVLTGDSARPGGRARAMHNLKVPTPHETEIGDLQTILIVVEGRGLPVDSFNFR